MSNSGEKFALIHDSGEEKVYNPDKPSIEVRTMAYAKEKEQGKAEGKNMDVYQRLELIECPRCRKMTLEYSHKDDGIHYICVNPLCDYTAVKKKAETKRDDGFEMISLVGILVLIVLAVAGVATF